MSVMSLTAYPIELQQV